MRQFWKALTSTPDQPGIELVKETLTKALFVEFLKMQPSEQAHSLAIARQLKEQGETHPDLVAAAMLHDIGKTRAPLKAWERASIVLAQRFFPESARAWGRSGEMTSWKRAFVVGEQHAEWGAEIAKKAGATELTIALIRRHQETIDQVTQEDLDKGKASLENYLLFRLQSVDSES